MADIPLICFEREDTQLSGEIRADLAAKGTPIGPYTHNTSVRDQKMRL
jgi:tRNA(fMet)-specific endonuclease VapC